MAEIMSPEEVWKGFDDSLPLESDILFESERDGVVFQHISFLGRETLEGRVNIFSLYCYDKFDPSDDVIVLMPDSRFPADEDLCAFFVKRGYSVLCPDCFGAGDESTVYPECVSHAKLSERENICACPEGVDKTCWYEWVAVGLYARRYALARTNKDSVALVGIRDGGEIAWKMAAIRDFSCAATLAAAGWLGYVQGGKFDESHPLSDEDRRFVAGMDSQSYAPLVKCPIFMGCTMNDPLFDCDRAFDTFSRINPAFAGESSISYSVYSNALLDEDVKRDLFLFLSKHQKGRDVFVAAPAAVEISVDEDENLKASVKCDIGAIRQSVKLFFAEDELLPSRRHWMSCKSAKVDGEYLLNVYRDTQRVFVLARVEYANGYAAFSKILCKKVSGTFKNSENRSAVIYSGDMDVVGFFADESKSLGGIFSCVDEPRAEEREGIRALCSQSGVKTARVSLPRFRPDAGSSLKMDIYSEKDSRLVVSIRDLHGTNFFREENVVGGVWQSFVGDEREFKCETKGALDFSACGVLTILCDSPFSVNNVMWL